MKDHETVLPAYTNHDSFLMPKGFPVDGFTSGLKYQAQPNDLFVATYPKCGTTWTQHIVHLILNDGVPVSSEERLDQLFPHLEEVGAEFVAKRPLVAGKYRLIKTHMPYDMTPQNPDAKYIFVARNPKDCVVSFFHHTRGFVKHYNFSKGDFDTYFDLFCDGKVDFGDYFACHRSWLDHRNDRNVLFLTYESMRAKTRETILKIASFLDPEIYPERVLRNDEEILHLILRHSSLDSMKKDPLRWSSARPPDHTPFIRKGNVGGWDELLKAEQVDRLDRRTREVFSKEELEFLGDKY